MAAMLDANLDSYLTTRVCVFVQLMLDVANELNPLSHNK